jgi:hypothetical protein
VFYQAVAIPEKHASKRTSAELKGRIAGFLTRSARQLTVDLFALGQTPLSITALPPPRHDAPETLIAEYAVGSKRGPTHHVVAFCRLP